MAEPLTSQSPANNVHIQFEELLCTEPDLIRRSFPDPKLLQDGRVLENLVAGEDNCVMSNSTYLDFQPEIRPSMRKVLANWMLEVCEEQHCENEVFYVAMNYVDRFLAAKPLPKKHFQLLGTACLFIASKLKEATPLTASVLVAYTAHSISVEDLLECEQSVCQVLKWDLSIVTPYDFIDQILARMTSIDAENAVAIQRYSAAFVAFSSTEMSVRMEEGGESATEITFSSYPASMMAAASVMAAAKGLLGKDWCASFRLASKLHDLTSADVECLQECQRQIEELIRHNFFRTAVVAGTLGDDFSFDNGSDSNDQTARSKTSCDCSKSSLSCTPTDVMEIEIRE